MGFFKFKNRDYDKIVTEAIQKIDFDPIAEEGEFKFYCGSDITGGYRFLNCNIVGPFQVRTKNSCKVCFSDGHEEIEIDSETVEINTDYSDTLGIGVTAFVVEIESKLLAWIENSMVKEIRITFKKESLSFSRIHHLVFKDLLNEENDDSEEEE
ncbi:MAG: hypothetical protein AAF487_00440 [Bacteroidota bacterium]